MNWEQDSHLKSKLLELVKNLLQNSEILEDVKMLFPMYPWSLRTLKRRLAHFKIKRNTFEVSPDELMTAVQEELNGPGQLLGYRAMHRKLRNEKNLFVRREDVYMCMSLLDPVGLKNRRLENCRPKFIKRNFKSKGSNWLWSLDGHDKLSGRCKAEFPLGIHGCVDSFSRKVIWLKVWPSNCNPVLPSTLFLKAVMDCGKIPCKMRSDHGGENSGVATIQMFMHNDEKAHLYGSSTTNHVIEKWWKGLKERQGDHYKYLIHQLMLTHYYDSTVSTCRVIMAYLYIPLIQKDLNSFAYNWNCHRIRKQNIYRPCGVVNHIYDHPERYGGIQCGTTPDTGRLKTALDNAKTIPNLRFLSKETESTLFEELKKHSKEEVSTTNVNEAYGILISKFKDEIFNFEFS